MNSYQRIFGSGPVGFVSSLALLAVARKLAPLSGLAPWGLPEPLRLTALLLGGGAALAIALWAAYALPTEERGRGVCSSGPYRYVRHPIYAAFLTPGALGLALYLDHPVFLLWALAIRPLWHLLIRYEERLMEWRFGDAWRRYARRTGRFLPRLSAAGP